MADDGYTFRGFQYLVKSLKELSFAHIWQNNRQIYRLFSKESTHYLIKEKSARVKGLKGAIGIEDKQGFDGFTINSGSGRRGHGWSGLRLGLMGCIQNRFDFQLRIR